MKTKPIIIGLTGGIASGKSTVRKIFESLGIKAVCADVAARQVVEKGSDALKEIRKHFGAEILTQDGSLNRKTLGGIIFSQPVEKKWLEGLLHPLIRNQIHVDARCATSPYVILDIPLLTESNIKDYAYIQSIIVISVDPELQVSRVCERDGISRTQTQKIIANQITILQSENKKLKKLLSISNEIKYKFITAKIISKSNLSFIRSSILMSGKKDNILLSSPVIYNKTLLGYINEVGFNSSRVLSLTDINVKAPAVILGKDVKVILAGNNSKYLDILNYLDISSLKSGDKVFTSGEGNMYPAGLYIGKVKIKLNGSFVVEPAENLNNLNYVQIINWKPEERGIDINIDPIFYE